MKFTPRDAVQESPTPPAERADNQVDEFRVYVGQSPINGKIASLIEIPPFTKLYPTLIVVLESNTPTTLYK